MTVLAASQAAGGTAALSGRREAYSIGPPGGVKKRHMGKRRRLYFLPAGDGKPARGVLGCLARARTGPADILARIRGIARDSHSGARRQASRVGGFLIASERNKLRPYSIGIAGSHVVALEKHGGVHAHGDGRARALRGYISKKAGLEGMRREEAARRPHVLAGDAAGHVDSAGGRDEYGFDLSLFAAGGTKLVEQDAVRRGRIDASFRTEGQAGRPAAHGGDAP